MSSASELRYLASHEWGRIDEEGILRLIRRYSFC